MNELEILEQRFKELVRKPVKSKNEVEEVLKIGKELEVQYSKETSGLLLELKEKGLSISSVWDLVNSSKSYKEAIPILTNHLSRPYHIKNKEGIVRALAVKEAKGIACQAIIEEYKKTPKDEHNLRWVFGNTMSIIITEDYLDDVIEIVKDESNGDSRQMFVAALGNLGSSKTQDMLNSLIKNKSQVVSKEAKKALKKIR